MNTVHFSQIDLNLLRVFEALLEEKNATRAGDRLGLSQSAVSHALGRLRALLGDDLFVRRAGGMEPTPRALEIGSALHGALQQIQAALAPAGFDPATTERRFVIAAGSYGCAVLIPAVVRALQAQAPGAALEVAAYGVQTLEVLDSGRSDAALMGAPAAGRRFHFQRLFTETMVWVVRGGHALTEGELTPRRLLDTPHVLVAGVPDPFDADAVLTGSGPKVRWDRPESPPSELARRPPSRQAAVIAPDSVSALSIALRTDMAAFVPHRLALTQAHHGRLAILGMPQADFPLEIGAVFREDRLADPAIAWLSRLLAQATEAL
jgi:DNA-binding transcriptional LysR family regulator